MIYTQPYTINPKYSAVYWKTEHTANFIPKVKINKKIYIIPNSIQIKIPFSQYKI